MTYFVVDVHRVWEYIDSKRRWRSVDPKSAITLENAFINGSGNVRILLSGINFIADFDSNLIRSDDGLTEYKVSKNQFLPKIFVKKKKNFQLLI